MREVKHGLIAIDDESVHERAQDLEFGARDAFEQDIIDALLGRQKLVEQPAASRRHRKPHLSLVVRISLLVDQAQLFQLVGLDGDERSAQMQMLGELVDRHFVTHR